MIVTPPPSRALHAPARCARFTRSALRRRKSRAGCIGRPWPASFIVSRDRTRSAPASRSSSPADARAVLACQLRRGGCAPASSPAAMLHNASLRTAHRAARFVRCAHCVTRRYAKWPLCASLRTSRCAAPAARVPAPAQSLRAIPGLPLRARLSRCARVRLAASAASSPRACACARRSSFSGSLLIGRVPAREREASR